MDTRQELLFGKLAIASKIITKEQFKQCLQIQRQKRTPLVKVMLKKKMLNYQTLPTLLEKYFREIEQRGLNDPGEELALCRLLRKTKKISLAVLGEIFTEHRVSGTSLGELLLKKKSFSVEMILDVYLKLHTETLKCHGCEKQFRLMRLTPGKRLRCKYCKTVFNVPNIENEILHRSKRMALAQNLAQDNYGDYEVIEEVAEGGMGIIYRAQKKASGRVVALKVLRESYRSSHEAKERFKREAWMLKQKLSNHKNIVTVYDIGFANDIPYFAMEFIEGQPLSEAIAKEPFAIEKSVQILIKLCEGIHYAHNKGIIHRDLKPSNVLLDLQGEPKITDFGLAKCVDSMTLVTRTGAMLGTPYYMSPEQAKGQLGLVGPRSDIYSLGVILYEMLTNTRPFCGETAVEIYHNILLSAPTPLGKLNSQVSKPLERICLKCLEKNPFHRHKTAEELANDLRKFQKRKASRWKRVLGKFRK